MIYTSEYFSLDRKGNLVNEKREQIFLRQGDMDGACSIYSLMMALIACGAIKRQLATDIWSPIDGRTTEARLVREFFAGDDGLFRDGMNLSVLADRLANTFGKRVNVEYEYEDESLAHEVFINQLCESIKEGYACLVGIYYSTDGGHAMLAVGYEETNRGDIKRIFCLDPGTPIQTCAYWNAAVEINAFHNASYCDRYLPLGAKVQLEDYITILKR